MIKQALENDRQLKPHQALCIFLKFMSSVMPTIEYQAGIDV